jgi:outer membrane protein OmpA-like peptidoglycan-associated protein
MIAATVLPGSSRAQDVEGSSDHALLSRFPGAVIRAYDHKEFDSFRLPLGRADKSDEFAEARTVEGETTWIAYEVPEERSTLEIFRSYRTALADAGFEILWECQTPRECGRYFDSSYLRFLEPTLFGAELAVMDTATERYLAARRSGPDGEQWVALFVYPLPDRYNVARLRIIEGKPMAEGLVTVDAETMRREIDETGHVSLYGILFDTNSADIQPASEPMLAEIAEFLATNARVKLYVVGHTDNTGGFEHNMRLSKERAAAVVEALESRHRVSPDRLQPVGVGPVAPVGSNQTDEGRAKNRRVELVHQ